MFFFSFKHEYSYLTLGQYRLEVIITHVSPGVKATFLLSKKLYAGIKHMSLLSMSAIVSPSLVSLPSFSL